MRTHEVTCIVPCYNESMRIETVINALSAVRSIEEIICVDDGSTDDTSQIIASRFPAVTLIRLEKNSGKSHAVLTALQRVRTEFTMLIDADLRNLSPAELDLAAGAIVEQYDVDMIILRKTDVPRRIRLFRIDTLLSGDRVMRTSDLEAVFDKSVNGFQLEIAIDMYMHANRKNVFWLPSSATNMFKFEKVSFLRGLAKDAAMYVSIVSYAGIIDLIRLFKRFCRRPLSDTLWVNRAT